MTVILRTVLIELQRVLPSKIQFPEPTFGTGGWGFEPLRVHFTHHPPGHRVGRCHLVASASDAGDQFLQIPVGDEIFDTAASGPLAQCRVISMLMIHKRQSG